MLSKMDDFIWDMKLRFKLWWADHMSGKHPVTGIIWWLMFRRYKDCKKFCPNCPRFDECFAEVRARYHEKKA